MGSDLSTAQDKVLGPSYWRAALPTFFLARRSVVMFIALLTCVQLLLLSRVYGKGMFLGDQLDQILAFTLLLKGDPTGLYGPSISNTNASAYNIGPLGSVIHGSMAWLGLNPDGVHLGSALLIMAVTAIFCWRLRRPETRAIGWLWCGLIVALPFYEQQMRFIWVVNFLPSMYLLLILTAIDCYDRPSVDRWLRTSAVWLLGMHLHPSAISGLGLVVMAAWSARSDLAKWRNWRISKLTGVLIAAAIGPYFIVEASTNFRNTKAVLASFAAAQSKPDHSEGLKAATYATQTMWRMLSFHLPGNSPWMHALSLALCIVLPLRLLAMARRKFRPAAPDVAANSPAGASLALRDWLLLGALLCILIQAAFYWKTNRIIPSSHYISYLIGAYTFLWAELLYFALSGVARRMRRQILLPVSWVCGLALAAVAIPTAELPPGLPDYSYSSLVDGVRAACAGQVAVRFIATPGFDPGVDRPFYTPLLQYLATRWVPECHIDEHATTVVLAQLNGTPISQTWGLDGRTLVLQKKIPPSIAVYAPQP